MWNHRVPSSPGPTTPLLPPAKPQLQQPTCLHPGVLSYPGPATSLPSPREPELPQQHPSGILGSPVALATTLLPPVKPQLQQSTCLHRRVPSIPGPATTLLPPVKPQPQQPTCWHPRVWTDPGPQNPWLCCNLATSNGTRTTTSALLWHPRVPIALTYLLSPFYL